MMERLYSVESFIFSFSLKLYFPLGIFFSDCGFTVPEFYS